MTSTYNRFLFKINHRAVSISASQDITSDNFEIRTDYEYRPMFNRLLTRKVM